MQMSLPDTAQTLCESWGFSIFPLRPKSKKPIMSWEAYQKQAPTPEQVEEWWDEDPKRNIAIACGKVSILVIVDADNDNAIRWVKTNFIKTPVTVKCANACTA